MMPALAWSSSWPGSCPRGHEETVADLSRSWLRTAHTIGRQPGGEGDGGGFYS